MRPKKHSHGKSEFLTSRAEGVIDDLDAFSGKQVYLDIENHQSGALIEDVLKQLGAVVHVFLVDEVNLVITDRKGWVASCSGADELSCQITLDTCSLTQDQKTSSELNSSEGKEDRHTTSRVGEMLHRAKQQTIEDTVDPLDLAAKNGIAIITLSDAQNLLYKILDTEVSNVKPLKAPFIKLDFKHGNYQPLFKEFGKNWPAVRINGSGNPFLSAQTKSTHFGIQSAHVEDKVTKRKLSEDHIDCQPFKEENRFPAKSSGSKVVRRIETLPSGSTENCNNSISSLISDTASSVVSGIKLHSEAIATVSLAEGVRQIYPTFEICRVWGPIVSQCLASLRLSEELKYDTVLSIPVHHSSGKFFAWLSRDSVSGSENIHVALTNCECDKSAIPTDKKHGVSQFPQSNQACSKDIFAVTGGTRLWISNKSENQCEHYSGFSDTTPFLNFTNKEEADVSLGSCDVLCESPTYKCSLTINYGGTDSSTNGKVLMQLALPINETDTSFTFTITTDRIKHLHCNDVKLILPLVDIGLLERVVCHLLSFIILEETNECWLWKISEKLEESGESILENKPTINFELVLPELSDDETLIIFFAQALDTFVQSGKVTSVAECGYCAELALHYTVKLFRRCENCFTCPVEHQFKKPKEVLSDFKVLPTSSGTCESTLFPTPLNTSTLLVHGETQNHKKLKNDKQVVTGDSRRDFGIKESESVKEQVTNSDKVETNSSLKHSKVSEKKKQEPKPMRKLPEATGVSESSIYANVAPGFCQICNCKYNSLADHINEQLHVEYMAKSSNFMEVDKAIREISRSSLFGRKVADKQ